MDKIINTCLVNNNLKSTFNLASVVRDYTQLLLQSDYLQQKLEALYNRILNAKVTKRLLHKINKLNDFLNELLVKIINLQYIINYHGGSPINVK